MKVVQLKEKESKFKVEVKEKTSAWTHEFIIYQWYDSRQENYESKFKLIIDLQQLSQKFVKVEKTRTSAITSDKTVTYLTIDDFNNLDLISIPFVMKRRSIKGNYHLDRFIYSTYSSEYLLEVEDDDINLLELQEIQILEDVSEDSKYLNINMTIPFEAFHKEELIKLCNILK